MSVDREEIVSVDFARKGKEGVDFYTVRIVRRDSNRRHFVGYLVRSRPNEDDWIAAIRAPGRGPEIMRAGKLDDARSLTTKRLLGKS